MSLDSQIMNATTRDAIRDIFTTIERYDGSLKPSRAYRRPILLSTITLVWIVVLILSILLHSGAVAIVLGVLALLYTPCALVLAKTRRLRPLPTATANQLYQRAVSVEVGSEVASDAPLMRHLLGSVMAHRIAESDSADPGLQGGTPGSRSDPEFLIFDFTTPECTDGEVDERLRDPVHYAFLDAIALPTRLDHPLKYRYPKQVDDENITPDTSLPPGAAAAIERLGEVLDWVQIDTDGSGVIVFTHEVAAIWPPFDPDLPLSDPAALRRAVDRSDAISALRARAKALLGVVEALEGGSTSSRPTLEQGIPSDAGTYSGELDGSFHK